MMGVNKEAIDFIKAHEGFFEKEYTDTVGIKTIGYGRNLEAYPLSEDEKRSILINDGKYSKKDASDWLIHHIEVLQKDLEKFSWFKCLDIHHQAIILDMAYNLGIPRLLLFKKMILALNSKDYITASREMLNSGWAMQVKTRAKALSLAMAETKELKKSDKVNV